MIAWDKTSFSYNRPAPSTIIVLISLIQYDPGPVLLDQWEPWRTGFTGRYVVWYGMVWYGMV